MCVRGGAWRRHLTPCVFSRSPSLPALDWQVPSRSGPYELRIEVQPKPHHRAHYETEGSRGAVKASAGGHPSVQVPVCWPQDAPGAQWGTWSAARGASICAALFLLKRNCSALAPSAESVKSCFFPS